MAIPSASLPARRGPPSRHSTGSTDVIRTLVIETSAAACSVALIEGGRVVDHRHELVGRGHAERLVPMIAELGLGGSGGGGGADAVLVDCGPGSFTGVRVGIAAARGLGIGWGVPVRGYSSTALIAALAHEAGHGPAIAVVLEGGHGEVFVQDFDCLEAAGPLASLTPAVARAALGARQAVGTGVRWLEQGVELFPDARGARLLTAAAADLPPAPIYGRAPDAKPMALPA